MELTELNLSEEQLKGVQEYLQTNLQSEGDKIRTKYSKEIKDLQAKLPIEKTAEELAKEKEYEDFKKEKAEFELSKALEGKGLDSKLAKYINMQGVEDLETYLKDFSDIIGSNNSFKPNKGNPTNKELSKEDFSKMSYHERLNLYNTNKDLYRILSE